MIAPVVDQAWWRAQEDEVVLADVRWYLDGRSGHEAYDAGHLPGAVFVDLDRWLAAHGGPGAGRHPLPDPAVFAEGMGTLGIGDDDVVLAYDDAGGVIAARLVWMLRATGHDAALLDGGLLAYDGPLEQRAVVRPAASFASRPWPAERLAGIDDASDRSNVVLDARPRDRYRGGDDAMDAVAGHIPGSRSLPCREHLAADGTLLPVEELRARFAAVGVADAGGAGAVRSDVVSSCGSGVTACHNLLAMERAGLGLGRLFPGSWSQYSQADRPVATGDAPG